MGFNKVSVLGVGLIGASLALSLKKHSLCEHISGYGRTKENLIKAKENGIIDSYEADPAKACADADLVIIATPVGSIIPIAEKISHSLKRGATVIDVGSVKGSLLYRIEGIMPEGVHYIGCHPIAGSEKSGLEYASPSLFNDALCIITETEKTDKNALARIIDIWKAIGARIVHMTPEEHDRIYGLVSHFPHIAVFTLVNTVADADPECIKYAGKGFTDTTRIAMSSPALWRDICLMNKNNILELIERFKINLDELGSRLKSEDAEGIEETFRKAKSLREKIDIDS